jgi:predicted transcriptional regulator of viral defense system
VPHTRTHPGVKSISVVVALSSAVKSRNYPVITDYEIFQLARRLYSDPATTKILRIRRASLPVRRGKNLIQQLERIRTITLDTDFQSSVYRVESVPDAKAEEIICLADPYGYISHLSAMQRHGLTNIFAVPLILTTLNFKAWKVLRDRTIQNVQRESLDKGYPLKRVKFKEVIRERQVIRHETSILGQWYQLEGYVVRIATIGQTFFDMLDKPKLCGGMPHILNVWQTKAQKHLEEIITRISLTDKKIVKVRAGYILEERLGIRDQRISDWQDAAERGGSRLLDPEHPYTNKFSEKWMISINI